jgi:aspartate kinase
MEKTSYIEEPIVRGVALTESEAKLTICNVPDKPGVAAKIFNELSKNNINVDMIVQNVSHKKITDISFTVPKDLLLKATKVSRRIANQIGAENVLTDEDVAKVSIVGVGMKSYPGVAARCFSILAKNKINIEMISTSEISISCVVRRNQGKKALRALHKEFNLDRKK